MFFKNKKTGAMAPGEMDALKRVIIASYGGRLQEAALAGRLFCVANQAKVAVTAGLTTTWTGLGIANPSGSGKIFIVHEFGWASDIVNPAEGVVGLMTSTDSGFAAAIAARSCRNGVGISKAYCDDGATIATPVLERVCGSTMEGAITTAPDCGPKIIDLKGSIILDPGRSVLTYHSIGGTASLIFNFLWEEVNEIDFNV
jgi:hypothetical protein